jgi:hypothetical protein
MDAADTGSALTYQFVNFVRVINPADAMKVGRAAHDLPVSSLPRG